MQHQQRVFDAPGVGTEKIDQTAGQLTDQVFYKVRRVGGLSHCFIDNRGLFRVQARNGRVGTGWVNYHPSFFTNSDFNFIAPIPSILQSMS